MSCVFCAEVEGDVFISYLYIPLYQHSQKLLTVSLLLKLSKQLSVFPSTKHLKFLIPAGRKWGRDVVSSETWRTGVEPACHWAWWPDDSCISSPLHWFMKPLSATVQTCRAVWHIYFSSSVLIVLDSCASLNSFIPLRSLQMCCLQFQAKGIKQQRCFQTEPFIVALTSLPRPPTTVPAK